MKKYLLIIVTLLFITPSVAFAAWWNPISWNWSALFNSPSSLQVQTQVQTVSTTTLPNTLSSTSTSVIATTSINIVATSTLPVSQPVKKVVQKVSPPSITTPTPSALVAPTTPTGILCNGTYFSGCPLGQNFICPQTGNAYCQTPQTPQSVSNPSQPQEPSVATTSSDSEYEAKKAVLMSIHDFWNKNRYIGTQMNTARQYADKAGDVLSGNNNSLCITEAKSAESAYDIANQMNLENTIPSNIPMEINEPLFMYSNDYTDIITNEKSIAMAWESVCTDKQNGMFGTPIINILNQVTVYEQGVKKALVDQETEMTAIEQANIKYFGADFSKLQAETETSQAEYGLNE